MSWKGTGITIATATATPALARTWAAAARLKAHSHIEVLTIHRTKMSLSLGFNQEIDGWFMIQLYDSKQSKIKLELQASTVFHSSLCLFGVSRLHLHDLFFSRPAEFHPKFSSSVAPWSKGTGSRHEESHGSWRSRRCSWWLWLPTLGPATHWHTRMTWTACWMPWMVWRDPIATWSKWSTTSTTASTTVRSVESIVWRSVRSTMTWKRRSCDTTWSTSIRTTRTRTWWTTTWTTWTTWTTRSTWTTWTLATLAWITIAWWHSMWSWRMWWRSMWSQWNGSKRRWWSSTIVVQKAEGQVPTSEFFLAPKNWKERKGRKQQKVRWRSSEGPCESEVQQILKSVISGHIFPDDHFGRCTRFTKKTFREKFPNFWRCPEAL